MEFAPRRARLPHAQGQSRQFQDTVPGDPVGKPKRGTDRNRAAKWGRPVKTSTGSKSRRPD